MTPAQQAYLSHLRGIRTPQSSSGGKKGGGILNALLGGVLGAAGAPITADQGPLPDGGNLGQSGLTPTYTGGEGKHFITLGNPNREQIKLGRFFRPRVNQDAMAALAADPLAPVQPEQETKGIGGFFRSMFGDNANERNAAFAEQQGQLRLKKWLMDQENQGKMGVLDKQHQLALALEDKRNQFQKERDAAQAEYGMQGRRYDAATDLSRDINRAFDDLLKDTRQQNFMAEQNRLDRASNEDIAGGRNEAMQLRYLLSQAGRGGGMDGFKVPPSLGYDPLSDSYTRWNDIDGKFETIPRMGGQAPVNGGVTGAPTPEQQALAKQKLAEVSQRQVVEQAGAPGSALSGFGRALGDATSDIASVIASPFGGVANWLKNNSIIGASAAEAGGALSAYDEAKKSEELTRLLQQRLLNARNR